MKNQASKAKKAQKKPKDKKARTLGSRPSNRKSIAGHLKAGAVSKDYIKYIDKLTTEQKKVVQEIKAWIEDWVPQIEATLSYGIPAFKVDGKVIGGVGVTQKGYSYYPFSGQVLSQFKKELAGFSQTLSALHFDQKKSKLTKNIVKKLIVFKLNLIKSKR